MAPTISAAKPLRIAAGLLVVVFYCVVGLVPAQAAAKDSDGDGMPNRWEKAHSLNANHANASGNPDRDGLTNLTEFQSETDPQDADTDDDGLTDGDEVDDFETDPTDPDTDDDGVEDGEDDSDDDGVVDGQEDGEDDEDIAGTISSFDSATGVLTLQSTLGASITGTLTAETELEWSDCEDGDATTADLVSGTEVSEMEFVDETTDLESVELVPAASCDDEDED